MFSRRRFLTQGAGLFGAAIAPGSILSQQELQYRAGDFDAHGLPSSTLSESKSGAVGPREQQAGADSFLIDNALQSETLDVNVRSYGAQGNGTTDDTGPIQTAIDNVATAGGGRVFVPTGIYLVGQLVLKNRVWLEGEGMRSSILRLKSNTNATMIVNQASPDGVAANAQFVAVRNLMLDGNKGEQTAGNGITWSVNPPWEQTANDDSYDSRNLVENVYIFNVKEHGYTSMGRSENRLINVHVFYVDGNGFRPNSDSFLLGCEAGACGLEGFATNGSSIRLTNCKAFFSGRVNPRAGHGFRFGSGHNGISLSSCEAQDNRGAGFLFDSARRVSLAACVADSNSTVGAYSYPGFDFWNSYHCVLEGCIAYERMADGTNSPQRNALRFRGNSTGNRVSLIHSAVSGARIGAPIKIGDSTDSVAGNEIKINSMGAFQSLAYTPSLTPDPYQYSTLAINLTGNIAINSPPYSHAGCPLTFIFLHDNSTNDFQLSWHPIFVTNVRSTGTIADSRTIVSFLYDGSKWLQTAAVVSL